MAFTIPDQGEGDNDFQSVFYQEELDVLLAGIGATDYVVSGGAITGGADMTPAVADVVVVSNGALFSVAGADVTVTAANATNPRLDLIVVTSAGSLAVRAGTAAATPKPPARTANDVVLGLVYVPANDTAIATTQITDLRVIRPLKKMWLGPWAAENFAGTAGPSTLTIDGQGVSAFLPMMLAGTITGIIIRGNDNRTAGTKTVEVYKNGVAAGLTAQLNGTDVIFDVTTQAAGLDTFAVGDTISVAMQTVGWTPTTSDDVIMVEVSIP
jgi:hypothetical protein